MRNLRTGISTLAAGIALTVATAGPVLAATASPQTTAATHQAASSRTVHPDAASECNWAPGPGSINRTCLDVTGTGLYVASVEGELDSTDWPYLPQTVCDVTVHVFGIYDGGAAYDQSAVNPGCGLGDLGEEFFPQADFQNGSLLCEQTEWSGQWSSPACITIHS